MGAVADTEREFVDCVGAIYGAATHDGAWLDVGDRIRRLFNAPRATLRIGSGPSGPPNVLMAPDDSESAYDAYYRGVDPFVARARRDFSNAYAHHIRRAKVSAELVPDDTFLRSEFYADFARLHGRRHMIGGLVGVADASPVALFRGEGANPFEARDVALLQNLLPHLQRALEIRQRLAVESAAAQVHRASLDALAFAIACVDAGLRIILVNASARQILADPETDVRIMRSGPHAGAGSYLVAGSRGTANTLRQLVISATSGGAGGSMPVASRHGRLAVLVSPCPRALTQDADGSASRDVAESLAMVILQPLDRAAPPPTDMLCDLYGFSRAEADVAAALSGGASAEEVARQRGVSLVTIRSQIRSILQKSDAGNLRDLERSMANLAALTPR